MIKQININATIDIDLLDDIRKTVSSMEGAGLTSFYTVHGGMTYNLEVKGDTLYVTEDLKGLIKRKMKETGVSATTLASYLGVTKQYISIMLNNNKDIPAERLSEMCAILGIER